MLDLVNVILTTRNENYPLFYFFSMFNVNVEIFFFILGKISVLGLLSSPPPHFLESITFLNKLKKYEYKKKLYFGDFPNKYIKILLISLFSVGHYDRIHTMWSNFYAGRGYLKKSIRAFKFGCREIFWNIYLSQKLPQNIKFTHTQKKFILCFNYKKNITFVNIYLKMFSNKWWM